MAIEIPRRQFLRCLTGLIAAPAVIKASALMKVVAVNDLDLAYDKFGKFESYVFCFRWQTLVNSVDWRYPRKVMAADHVSYVDVERLLSLSHESAQGGVSGRYS